MKICLAECCTAKAALLFLPEVHTDGGHFCQPFACKSWNGHTVEEGWEQGETGFFDLS